ncbi:hypothetical protein ABZW18_00180 [Streptomyces sp. NPDC004647]|uniref:hypothetical protein n=1 Tax=Streptomyces sp. NPDC004647 TaxID=3154671 RepID=UPI0033B9B802
MPRNALTTHALFGAAGVSEHWAWKALKAGVIHEPHFEEDVVALRVYACVAQIAWPGEKRPRSAKQQLELWQALAVNTAREALSDPATTRNTTMWVLPDGVQLATTAGQRAALELDVLSERSAFRIPIGLWIAELPDTLEKMPKSRHRRASKSATKKAASET